MNKLASSNKSLLDSFARLNTREKLLVGSAALFGVFFLLQSALGLVSENIEDTKALVVQRKGQLQEIGAILNRYNGLKQRREALLTTYEQSQMTFEQVTNELDRIVRDAIGNDNYDIKKPPQPTPFGFGYEKQEFTLIIKSLSLEQLVKLLYQIEQGGRPIFLSKVDIAKSAAGTEFSSVVEIYSIGKSRSPAAQTPS